MNHSIDDIFNLTFRNSRVVNSFYCQQEALQKPDEM